MPGESPPAPMQPGQNPTCGIVMPISAIDGLTEPHWQEVKAIISDAVANVGFVPRLVSDADDSGIIQKRIVQNLYSDPIVVCDVSGRNPNVMCELGMRLAFDKPTVIIKDDKTPYSFDTGIIEHLDYPRDLRFGRVVAFKEALGRKVSETHNTATKDKNYSTFLKHFGPLKVAKVETTEATPVDFILDEMQEIRRQLNRLSQPSQTPFYGPQDGIGEFELPPGVIDRALGDVMASYSKATGKSSVSFPTLRSYFYKLPAEERQTIASLSGVTVGQIRDILNRRCGNPTSGMLDVGTTIVTSPPVTG